ncbi:hypothetical protein Esti_006277 [Eimeria stiedai]
MTLRALVGVKRVVDYVAKVYAQPDKKGDKLDGQKFSINPFCEIAVEAAVRLKEQKHVTDILAVSIGCDRPYCVHRRSRDQLQTAMALGADRAMMIKTPLPTDQLLQPLAVAKIFKKIVETENPGLVILGKQAIDSDSNQVGQILAALLDWPQITFCSALEVKCKTTERCILGAREIDQGLQQMKFHAVCGSRATQVRVPLPAVVTCDLRLNKPRYATLPNVIKARKRPIEVKTAEELGVDVSPRLEILSVEEPPQRKKGLRVSSVDELLEKLTQAGVIS